MDAANDKCKKMEDVVPRRVAVEAAFFHSRAVLDVIQCLASHGAIGGVSEDSIQVLCSAAIDQLDDSWDALRSLE